MRYEVVPYSWRKGRPMRVAGDSGPTVWSWAKNRGKGRVSVRRTATGGADRPGAPQIGATAAVLGSAQTRPFGVT